MTQTKVTQPKRKYLLDSQSCPGIDHGPIAITRVLGEVGKNRGGLLHVPSRRPVFWVGGDAPETGLGQRADTPVLFALGLKPLSSRPMELVVGFRKGD